MLSVTHDMMDYRDPWKQRGGYPAWPRGDQEKLLGNLSPHQAGLEFPLGTGLPYPDGVLPFGTFRCELEGRGCLCPQRPSGMPTVGE